MFFYLDFYPALQGGDRLPEIGWRSCCEVGGLVVRQNSTLDQGIQDRFESHNEIIPIRLLGGFPSQSNVSFLERFMASCAIREEKTMDYLLPLIRLSVTHAPVAACMLDVHLWQARDLKD